MKESYGCSSLDVCKTKCIYNVKCVGSVQIQKLPTAPNSNGTLSVPQASSTARETTAAAGSGPARRASEERCP